MTPTATETPTTEILTGDKLSAHLKNLSYKSRAEKLAAHLVNVHGARPADLDDHEALVKLHAELHNPTAEDVIDEDGNELETGTIMNTAETAKAEDKPAKEKPQPVKRVAKQELARVMVKAMDEAARTLAENATIMAGMTPEEAYRAVAQWVHHLPVGDVWPGETLPCPQRSDWDAKTSKDNV